MFSEKLPKEQRMNGDILGQNDISDAETYWVRKAQTKAFPSGEKEKSKQILPSKVRRQAPTSEQVSSICKRPRIRRQALTRLITLNRHEKLSHNSGVEHLLTEVRSRLWNIKGRRTVRNVVEKCL